MFAVLLVLYLLVLLFIGVFSGRATRGAAGFYVADRSLGLFRCSSSLSATVISASATIVGAHLVARYGLAGVWFNIAGSVGLLILGLFFARRVRATGRFTLPELAGELYQDQWIRKLASYTSLAAALAWLALLIRASSDVLAIGLPDLSSETAVAFIVVVLGAYTMLGGQRAVADSDVIQLLILVLGFTLVGIFFVVRGHGDLSSLPREELSFPTSESFGWDLVLVWCLLTGLPHLVGSDIYGKLLSARDETTARRSCFIAAATKLLFGFLLALVVLKAKATGLLLDGSGPASNTLGSILGSAIESPFDSIFLLALLAILMSSMDSVLLTASSIVAHDVVGEKVEELDSQCDRTNLRMGRIASLVMTGLAVLLALDSEGTVVNLFRLGYTIFAGGLGPLILFGFFRERLGLKRGAARWAVVMGGGTALTWTYLERWEVIGSGLDPVLPGVFLSTAVLLIFRERRR